MKKIVPFDENTAAEIVEKFNLNAAIVAKWRFRGEIPEKYFSDMSEKVTDIAILQKISEILNVREIAPKHFRTFSSKKGYRIISEETTISENELIALKTELVEIRNLLALCISHPTQDNFKKLFRDKRVHHTPLLDSAKFQIRVTSSNFYFENEAERKKIKQKLAIFRNKLLIDKTSLSFLSDC
jgi:hypothetical protein